jgi:predicted transcriptional regulator
MAERDAQRDAEIVSKIERALKDVAEGRVVSHAEGMRRIGEAIDEHR